MPDSNMGRALKLARTMSKIPKWYKSEGFPSKLVAIIVHAFDYPLVQSGPITRAKASAILSVYMRWWSGCLSAAKTIAMETRDGPVTPARRSKNAKKLLALCKKDKVYADGVRAAVAFKQLRKQEYSFKGMTSTQISALGWKK